MRKLSFIVPVAVVLIALFMSTVFIVDERNKALVLQFGRVVAVKEDPGLEAEPDMQILKFPLFKKLSSMMIGF